MSILDDETSQKTKMLDNKSVLNFIVLTGSSFFFPFLSGIFLNASLCQGSLHQVLQFVNFFLSVCLLGK